MRGAREIVPVEVRSSAITSNAISIPDLAHLLEVVPADAPPEAYRQAAVGENALAIATESGRKKRFTSLRRLYVFRRDTVLFRALRDLWEVEEAGRPLLASLCAMATDTVFRASSMVIIEAAPEAEVTRDDFAAAIDSVYPGAYAASTLKKAAENAYASWQQSGHLGQAEHGRRLRRSADCQPSAVAFALLLGNMQDLRGEALFETPWAQILDRPRTQLYDLAFAAAQRGMIEYRNAGGVVEVGFRELLRPFEGELF